jgi:hypothetical protein
MKRIRYKKQKDLIKSAVKKVIAVTPEERLADYVLRLKGIRLSKDELREVINVD